MKALLFILSTVSVISEAKSFLPARINSSKPVVAERYQDNVYKVWKTEDFDDTELSKQTLDMLQFADYSIHKRFTEVTDFNQIISIQSRIIKGSQQKQYFLTLSYHTNNHGLKNIYALFNALNDKNPRVAAFNFSNDSYHFSY